MIIDAVTITMPREELERLLATAEYYANDLRKRATAKHRDGSGRPTHLAAQRLAQADRLDTTAHNLLAAIRWADAQVAR